MKLVKQILDKQFIFGGEEPQGWLPPNAARPLPTPVRRAILDLRIYEVEGGFSFEWVSRNTGDQGDTWHQTLEDALHQASFQFGIEPAEWNECKTP